MKRQFRYELTNKGACLSGLLWFGERTVRGALLDCDHLPWLLWALQRLGQTELVDRLIGRLFVAAFRLVGLVAAEFHEELPAGWQDRFARAAGLAENLAKTGDGRIGNLLDGDLRDLAVLISWRVSGLGCACVYLAAAARQWGCRLLDGGPLDERANRADDVGRLLQTALCEQDRPLLEIVRTDPEVLAFVAKLEEEFY